MLLVTFVSFLEASYATVGGPQLLTFLGHKENNLYFIYEYHDEMDNPPELWHYDISGDSLYINREWINYPDESIGEALNRHNLDVLKNNIDTVAASHEVEFNFGEPVQRYMETMEVFYDLYPVRVQWGNEVYNIFQCYDRVEQPEIHRAYTLKDLKISIAIIRYKGVCFESGYLKDTLLVKPYQEGKSTDQEQKVAGTDDEDQLPLIIALVALSAILMLIVLFRRK